MLQFRGTRIWVRDEECSVLSLVWKILWRLTSAMYFASQVLDYPVPSGHDG